MNLRTFCCSVSLPAALLATACGQAPGSDIKEHLRKTTAAATGCEAPEPSKEMPLTLRLTSVTMPARSNSPSLPVDVYVTLPGQGVVSTHVGSFAPAGASDPNNQFNCSTVDLPPDQNGNCTAKLPMVTTIGPVTFTGALPPTIGSATASVRINDTPTTFTMDRLGGSTATCASAFMKINNQIDGDKITVCWTVGVPYIAPPLLEAVYYLAPGERSSIGLSQANSSSIKTTWQYQSGRTISVKFPIGTVTESVNIQSSDSISGGQTITTGATQGFMQSSNAMFADPNQNIYLVIVGANGSLVDLNDGSDPTYNVDLGSGFLEKLTFGQMKGLALDPQDVSTINLGDQCPITTYITSAVAQTFVAQDPFATNTPIAQTIANSPNRFIAAVPPQTALLHACAGCGPSTTNVSTVHGSSTDQTIGQSTGTSLSLLGFNDSTTVSVTYTDTNQSTATINLSTNDTCIEGAVNLYMDKNFGTILPVPLLEDTCKLPVECDNHNQHQLDYGQSLVLGGPALTSCNGQWSLSFQPDGTLSEFYLPGGPVLVTTFYAPGAVRATMESSGDFVLYDANNNLLTDSGTANNQDAFLILEDTGFISIYNRRVNPVTGDVGAGLPAIWTLAPGG